MTIKLPVTVEYIPADNGNIESTYIVDADGTAVLMEDVAEFINVTETAPDLTAIANRILDAAEEQGLAAWTLLNDDDCATCRADLVNAITAILRDARP